MRALTGRVASGAIIEKDGLESKGQDISNTALGSSREKKEPGTGRWNWIVAAWHKSNYWGKRRRKQGAVFLDTAQVQDGEWSIQWW